MEGQEEEEDCPGQRSSLETERGILNQGCCCRLTQVMSSSLDGKTETQAQEDSAQTEVARLSLN